MSSLSSIRFLSMSTSLLFVSAQMPGPWLPWIQLPAMSAPFDRPELHRAGAAAVPALASTSSVLLPTISLFSTCRSVRSPQQAFSPY